MGEQKSKPWPDPSISPETSAGFFHFRHTVYPRVSNKCNFPAIYKDKKVNPAKDAGDDFSTVTFFRMFKVCRTARMTAWKAFEAIIDNVAVRLVTYCYSGKTKGRINHPRIWIAATNKV